MKMITLKEFTVVWCIILFSVLLNSAKASESISNSDNLKTEVQKAIVPAMAYIK